MFESSDFADLVLSVFNRYIALARRLQTTYSLEPAGSRGVCERHRYCSWQAQLLCLLLRRGLGRLPLPSVLLWSRATHWVDKHSQPTQLAHSRFVLHGRHKHLKPKSARYREIFDHFSKDYMYLAAIKWVNDIKASDHPCVLRLSSQTRSIRLPRSRSTRRCSMTSPSSRLGTRFAVALPRLYLLVLGYSSLALAVG